MRYSLVLLSALLTISTFSAAAVPPREHVALSKSDVALFAEGFLEGILGTKYSDLEKCSTDIEEVALILKKAVEDIEKKTFSSVKLALHEISDAVHRFPIILKDCSIVEEDYKKILEMIKIFEHPFSLVYHVGKNLVVNGIDIFRKTHEAIEDFENHDYFDFGYYLAEAIEEIFLRSPIIKDSSDE